MVGKLEEYVGEMKRGDVIKLVKEGEPPMTEFELGCLGRYERVRLDVPVADPSLYGDIAVVLEELARQFRIAQMAKLPPPRDVHYHHERVMLILAQQRKVQAGQRLLAEMWKRVRKLTRK